ncbi:hypothetical protein SCLCIDRAFT_1210286 [Scleroderma citrinum Foug A]|uniref:Uncharacterized protein n=1 Tax=Scleroderma citrinum Foug A TaxID=1036808 RepID=A0A0C3ARS9_9AGAM|nr:hypothetical protein SCLCIDRAFT_1210286 [Scleroderma citrinum Foug A]
MAESWELERYTPAKSDSSHDHRNMYKSLSVLSIALISTGSVAVLDTKDAATETGVHQLCVCCDGNSYHM